MDTIFALATPPGKSGVAIIRISGPESYKIAKQVTNIEFTPRIAHYCDFTHNRKKIDSIIAIYFQSPASFTGEDCVELHLHGSRAIIAMVSKALEELGLRNAEAGEFTRRALQNGKLDMLQVEALSDLLEADTQRQAEISQRNLDGAASEWVENIKDILVESLSLVALAIDFSDEEIPDDLFEQISSKISVLAEQMEYELNRSHSAKDIRTGYRVAIIGAPNSGKSSLMNYIAGKDIAIATDIPGTTRDIIEHYIDLKGYPVILQDTAGIHKAKDKVEEIGIEKARAAAEKADIRIFLYEDKPNYFNISPKNSDIIIQSKADIHGFHDGALSTKTGYGVDNLLEKIIISIEDNASDPGFFAHERQIESLKSAKKNIMNTQELLQQSDDVLDFVAEELRMAIFSMDRLIGKVDVEDLLDVIFSRFCIGK